MDDNGMRGLESKEFRANPAFELVLFDRLSPEEQRLLEGLRDDPDLYGVLRPREGAGLGLKSACRETALLFLTLQVPGPLPNYVGSQFGTGWQRAIGQMVLDGILEIEHEGTFYSGPQALEFIQDRAPGSSARSRVAQLSIDALQYAQALPIDDAGLLSQRLYAYNRVPLTPAWKRQYPTPEAVAERLGIGTGGENRRDLEKHWVQAPSSASRDGWFAWSARHSHATSRKGDTTYKLYVSPDPAEVPAAFGAVVGASAGLGAMAFKVGRDAYGLLRPDKLVIYFANLEDLAAGADHLQRALEGCLAQGVPFSAAVSADGLLSWGIDPPQAAQTPLPLMGESWRLWLTNRLARALLVARAAPPAALEPWQFAMERLRLEGVDTGTWAPTNSMWHKYTATE